MTSSMSERCRACVRNLRDVISALSEPGSTGEHVEQAQVTEELDRFTLFVGNIGGFHDPESSMSVESRLREAKDVLNHIFCLLDDLNEAAEELRQIVSGERQGMTCVLDENEDGKDLRTSEEHELRDEIRATITRLFRVLSLVRQAAPTDPFAKALNRNRYHFSDQYDIAHVGQRYPNLDTEDKTWLRQRLGRAITDRRRYLSYMQDHRDKLEREIDQDEDAKDTTGKIHAPTTDQPRDHDSRTDIISRPSFSTQPTTIIPQQITLGLLNAEELDSGDDTHSYTTVSRSVDGNDEPSDTVRIPRLENLRSGDRKEIECPFCFRVKNFKNESVWRQHVFYDIRPYVCTFPDCDAPYFGDINKWFQHEMSYHRVAYKCFLCPNTLCHQEKDYVAHLKRRHPSTFDRAESEQAKTLAQVPLSEIPAADCPCCTDWVDRLKEHAGLAGGLMPNEVLTVNPTAFKRHLAKHLEQLAVFAIPTSATVDDPDDSTDAHEVRSYHTAESELSDLSFSSERRRDGTVSDGEKSSGSAQHTVISAAEDASPMPIWNSQYGRYLHTSFDSTSGRQFWTHYIEGQGWVFFQWYQAEHQHADSGSSGAAQAGPYFQIGTGQAIPGTYNYAQPAPNSHLETLDSSFYIRHGKFFQPGKVFSVLFSEGAGSNATRYNDSISIVKYGGRVHTQIRRFIVVQAKNGFAYSVPIFTYSNQGTNKPGVVPSEHAIAYSYGYQPVLLPGETGIEKDPICIIMNPGERALSTASRIFFGIQHPIQYNVKVKDLGYVHPDHLVKFRGYWAMEQQMGSAQDMQDIGEDHDGNEHPNTSTQGYSHPQTTQDVDKGEVENIASK